MSIETISAEKFFTDPSLLGKIFSPREAWDRWIVFVKSCFGEPLTEREQEIFKKFTKRSYYPAKPYNEAWLCVGRRGGKSRVLSAMSVYLAYCFDWRKYLSKGEVAQIPIVAADRKQAEVIFNYIKGIIFDDPFMKSMVVRDTQFELELKTGVAIAIKTASYRTIRGSTVVAALFDEIAFWKDEHSSNPDTEIVNAIRPAMITIPNSMLFCASSPFRERGVLYNMYKKYYGVDDDSILVWKAPTWEMNLSIPEDFIERERKRDPISFRTEYGAEFRRTVDDFVPEKALDAVTDFGVLERPPVETVNYIAFVDPSGGTGDSFTCAIAHTDSGVTIIDRILEYKPPFDPRAIVKEMSEILKEYKVYNVLGDRYAGEWPRQTFNDFGIQYEVCTIPKTELYRQFLPIITGGRVRLLDHGVLRNQLLSLERRLPRSGAREVIDHPRGMHDDVANVVAGICVSANATNSLYFGFV